MTPKDILASILPYLGGLILFYILLVVFINNQAFLTYLGALVSITAFFFVLMYESTKNRKEKFIRKKSLTVYKRNLLFKLDGTVSTVYQTLFNYIANDIHIGTSLDNFVGTMSIRDYIRIQFDNYKIYYEDIRYFSTSDIVPIEIKEKLEFLNLDAEKIIHYLPVDAGWLNKTIFTRYLKNLLIVIKWSIEDEDSCDIIDAGLNLSEWVEMMLKIPDMPQMRRF